MPIRKPTTLDLYGCRWPTTDPIRIELECIKRDGSWTTGATTHGLGLPAHIINFARLVWPWFKWHRWATDLILPQLVRPHSRTGLFGPSNSGKSCLCGMTALTLYYAHPDDTTVIVSSTTKDDLEVRIWGEIKRFHSEARERCPWLPGNLTESKQLISTDGKGEEDGRDFRNGLMGRPVRKGGTWVGLGSLVGIKNTNMIQIADELHLMNDGFLDSSANLSANPNFRGWYLGNLSELGSQLGLACEPSNGWDSIDDSPVSRVFTSRWHNGLTVQLIGQDSPQLDFPEGAEPFGPLIGRRYLSQCEHDYGKDTPLYNMFAAGKIPRGTMENRVITHADCLRHHAYEPVTWGHEPITRLYCADLSYTAEHGDRTVGRPLAWGKDSEGKLRLAPLERPLVYTPNDRSGASVEEQLASQMMAECLRLGIPPSRVFYDGTGRSSFTAALMRMPPWLGEPATSVNPIEFGGAASARPNFVNRRYHEDRANRTEKGGFVYRKEGDLLPCDEVFGKMVSELWFALRALVEADQARGFDEATIKEAAMRLWTLSLGNKMDVEPKKEMKLRLGRSPDLADCLVVGVEGARRLGFPLGQLLGETKQRSRWLERLNRDYREAREAVELAA